MSDFSRTSVDKAVLKDTIIHPASIYPASITVLGGMGFLLFQSPVALAAASAGLAFGVGGWIFNRYFRHEYFSRKYLDALHEQIRKETRKRLTTLHNDLRQVGSTQGLSQLPRLKAKFDNFVEILDSKMEKEELTYGRYLGVSEQVYLSTVDNLIEVAAKLKSVSAIDTRYISKRLRDLARDKSPTAREEEVSLKDRLSLVDKTREETLDLLSDNEAAMTTLDKAAAALAGIKTHKGAAGMDMEFVMKELETLANRAHIYDNRRKKEEPWQIQN
ncbi:MAG: hypothetical protein OEZ04_03910 [Nitrospinota bacterium]|nr:hypothetical protein [Nitrospinota bacterium]